MKMNKKLEDAFNLQIKNEKESSYLYMAMAAYFDYEGFKGMSNWMKKQAHEEYTHAMKLYSFMVDRGNRVVFDAMAKPQTNWKSAQNAFEDVLKHEQEVTKMIDSLFNLARKEGDLAAEGYLQWFVKEQVEEEASAQEVLDKLKLIGNNSALLIMLDVELGKRE